MDGFTPDKKYHPEDEYETLENVKPAPDAASAQSAPRQEPQAAPFPVPGSDKQTTIPAPPFVLTPSQQPEQKPAQQAQQAQPVQQTQPVQQAQPPFYAAYRQPAAYTQPAPQPMQQPMQYTYPNAGYQQAVPVYPQAPVQPRPQQAPPTAQPVYQQAQPTQQIPASQQAPVSRNIPATQQQPAARQPYAQQTYAQQTYTRQPVQNELPLSPNPYAQGYNRMPAPTYEPPKPATPTGTKVFIIILCALLVAMVAGFIVYIAGSAKADKQPNSEFPGNFSFDNGDNGNDDNGNGFEISPFGGGFGDNNNNNSFNSVSYTEVEDEISLKADNGDTQKRDDDNPDSVGQPDASAKDIVLSPLPKDKDDEKYSTQSAYETVSDSVVTVICYQEKITDDESDIVSQGTGTIISADGYLITNAHVIGNSRAYAVNIVLNSGEKYQAKIVGYDTWTDLAVLKIDAAGLKAVTFGDSNLIEIGDDVIAIGSPGGEKFQNSLTKGIVSAVDRELSVNKYVRYIQSDAAISPGSSGGPLCNIYGQVIGITTAKTVATYYENMSFSIPSATVEEIVGDLMRYGYVQGRARIGISGVEVSEEEIFYYNTPAGVVIEEIDENGSIAGTDIREGDILTELDGKTITSFQDIYDVLADHKPEDKVSVKVQRPSN